MAPVAGEDDVGVGEGGGVGIGGDYAAAGGLEAADIVFVVADEYDVFGFNLMLSHQFLKQSYLLLSSL